MSISVYEDHLTRRFASNLRPARERICRRGCRTEKPFDALYPRWPAMSERSESNGAESMISRSNPQTLWEALKAFFKDNPSWE